jgi:hypothetical protein
LNKVLVLPVFLAGSAGSSTAGWRGFCRQPAYVAHGSDRCLLAVVKERNTPLKLVLDDEAVPVWSVDGDARACSEARDVVVAAGGFPFATPFAGVSRCFDSALPLSVLRSPDVQSKVFKWWALREAKSQKAKTAL